MKGEWVYETSIITCPWKLITPFTRYISELYSHYEKGYLLYDGAISDQPNWYLEAMEVFGNELTRIKNMRQREQMERSKRGIGNR